MSNVTALGDTTYQFKAADAICQNMGVIQTYTSILVRVTQADMDEAAGDTYTDSQGELQTGKRLGVFARLNAGDMDKPDYTMRIIEKLYDRVTGDLVRDGAGNPIIRSVTFTHDTEPGAVQKWPFLAFNANNVLYDAQYDFDMRRGADVPVAAYKGLAWNP